MANCRLLENMFAKHLYCILQRNAKEVKNMTEVVARCIREQPRFRGIFPDNGKFGRGSALSLPEVCCDGDVFIEHSIWGRLMSQNTCADKNICALEIEAASFFGASGAVAFKSGVDAVRMAVRLAAEEIYGSAGVADVPGAGVKKGALSGKRVFCADFMPPRAVNVVIEEGGEPVFIDVSPEDWCMDPEVLEIAFKEYRDVKLVVMNYTYGFPGQVEEVKKICRGHGALLIEDASEGMGAKVNGRQAGSLGDYGILDFDRSAIAAGVSGGMLLVHDSCKYEKVKCQAAHGGAGKGFGMEDAAAVFLHSYFKNFGEYIAKKKAIYQRCLEKFDGGFISMNPVGGQVEPNYWMSCMVCDSSIQFQETRSGRNYTYTDQHGTASPMEVCDALAAFGAQAGPVYRPLSSYPRFQQYDQVSLDGCRKSWKFGDGGFWVRSDVSRDCFERGLCLPSDVRMTEEEQGRVIEIVLACFNRIDFDRSNMLFV